MTCRHSTCRTVTTCPVGQMRTRLHQTWLETTQRSMSTISRTLSRTLSGSGLAGQQLLKASHLAAKVPRRSLVLTAPSVVLIELPNHPKEPTSEASKSTHTRKLLNKQMARLWSNSPWGNFIVESLVFFYFSTQVDNRLLWFRFSTHVMIGESIRGASYCNRSVVCPSVCPSVNAPC